MVLKILPQVKEAVLLLMIQMSLKELKMHVYLESLMTLRQDLRVLELGNYR